MSDHQQQPDNFKARLKSKSLAFWGAMLIFGGVFSNLFMTLAMSTRNMRRAEERAARLGSGVAAGLLILIGIVLIVVHFVRKKR